MGENALIIARRVQLHPGWHIYLKKRQDVAGKIIVSVLIIWQGHGPPLRNGTWQAKHFNEVVF